MVKLRSTDIYFFWKYGGVYYNLRLERGCIPVSATFSPSPSGEDARQIKTCEIIENIIDYFSGRRVEFSKYEEVLMRSLTQQNLSNFAIRVLKEVMAIPYGETRTYSEIARNLSTSPRAVGQAVKRNPLPVLIPCHRVVGKDGIGGYTTGKDVNALEIKKKLLDLEKRVLIWAT